MLSKRQYPYIFSDDCEELNDVVGYCRRLRNDLLIAKQPRILNGESIMLTDNELVVRIKGLMSRSWDVKISHVRREANMVVDGLSLVELLLPSLLYEVELLLLVDQNQVE
ncbi:hypothetical protein V6N11_017131 [Hibiscus sabdariffa]|uniref:RNase H type-1 domain-containing protein n=1 Tax=Hibiscus sabdariffa TaxID=183260 RepID=A0ABR2TXH4_9ROSI